jgi:hypothetical protein
MLETHQGQATDSSGIASGGYRSGQLQQPAGACISYLRRYEQDAQPGGRSQGPAATCRQLPAYYGSATVLLGGTAPLSSLEGAPMPRRRVVVTGVGLVTPLGTGVGPSWARLLAGDSAVGRTTRVASEERLARLPCQLAAQVRHGAPPSPAPAAGYPPPSSDRAGDGCIVSAPWQVVHGEGAAEFDSSVWVPRELRRHTQPYVHYALGAGGEALAVGSSRHPCAACPRPLAATAAHTFGRGSCVTARHGSLCRL